MPDPTPTQVVMIQDGARRHYALPRALAQAGMLHRMYTDWYSAPGSIGQRLARIVSLVRPALGQRMLDRVAAELPQERIRAAYLLVLRDTLRGSHADITAVKHRRQAEELARWILRRNGLQGGSALLGFIRNLAPELCQAAREQGLRVVADQIIAPAAVERMELTRQFELAPDWEPAPSMARFEAYQAWEEATWPHVDQFICMSDYVRDGLLSQGVAADRVRVLPYPFDAGQVPFVDRAARPDRPVTIGFVGAVSLRKGAHYFFELARRFRDQAVRFVMVGPIRLVDQVVQEHRNHVEFVGGVPRSEVAKHLAGFDIFYFPSCCEGSAGSLTEAMASGLPVVTSPNSGTTARHGREGFVLPYDDLDQTEACLATLVRDREQRLAMGRAARQRVERFHLGWYAHELQTLFCEPTPASPPGEGCR